ncbi:hypothetical protein, partial [Candidatus Frankia nodulisporulans]
RGVAHGGWFADLVSLIYGQVGVSPKNLRRRCRAMAGWMAVDIRQFVNNGVVHGRCVAGF